MTGFIHLKEDSDKSIVTWQKFDYTENDAPDYYDQLFTNPGIVQAGVKYVITVQYDPPGTKIWRGSDNRRGSDGLVNASGSGDCFGETVNFEFSDAEFEDTNGSDQTMGQIPRILFNCYPIIPVG